MLNLKTLGTAMFIAISATSGCAETHEIQMVNNAESGRMAFEPDFIRIAPGDTVKFLVSDKGHNAETIKTMVPDSESAFVGKINEEIEVTLSSEGVYGIKCKPHYNMGMVMTIAVGDITNAPDDFFEGRIPKKAVERFEAQFANLNISF